MKNRAPPASNIETPPVKRIHVHLTGGFFCLCRFSVRRQRRVFCLNSSIREHSPHGIVDMHLHGIKYRVGIVSHERLQNNPVLAH